MYYILFKRNVLDVANVNHMRSVYNEKYKDYVKYVNISDRNIIRLILDIAKEDTIICSDTTMESLIKYKPYLNYISVVLKNKYSIRRAFKKEVDKRIRSLAC